MADITNLSYWLKPINSNVDSFLKLIDAEVINDYLFKINMKSFVLNESAKEYYCNTFRTNGAEIFNKLGVYYYETARFKNNDTISIIIAAIMNVVKYEFSSAYYNSIYLTIIDEFITSSKDLTITQIITGDTQIVNDTNPIYLAMLKNKLLYPAFMIDAINKKSFDVIRNHFISHNMSVSSAIATVNKVKKVMKINVLRCNKFNNVNKSDIEILSNKLNEIKDFDACNFKDDEIDKAMIVVNACCLMH